VDPDHYLVNFIKIPEKIKEKSCVFWGGGTRKMWLFSFYMHGFESSSIFVLLFSPREKRWGRETMRYRKDHLPCFEDYWLRDAPTGLTFNNYTLCPHRIYVFCINLRINSDICPIQHKLIGFYNRDEKCLLRGTNWVFK